MTIRIAAIGVGHWHSLYDAAYLRTLVKMPDAVRLIVQGVQRFKIVEQIHEHPYLRARIEVIEEPPVHGTRDRAVHHVGQRRRVAIDIAVGNDEEVDGVGVR